MRHDVGLTIHVADIRHFIGSNPRHIALTAFTAIWKLQRRCYGIAVHGIHRNHRHFAARLNRQTLATWRQGKSTGVLHDGFKAWPALQAVTNQANVKRLHLIIGGIKGNNFTAAREHNHMSITGAIGAGPAWLKICRGEKCLLRALATLLINTE